ncbi:MAG TPA: YciI family protein [Anaeromyxobacteraceae bacterium]|nr:YciI family protein [Anaeromyxobacteraceae bacterium]
MRVMVIVKASEESERGAMPKERDLAEMGAFNEQLAEAGVMLAGEGLRPSSRGKRIRFSGKEPTVIDGPFGATTELAAGYWIWQVKDLDEAVTWAKRAPFGAGAELELRPIFEAEDFGAELTPELRAREERLRAGIREALHH